MTRLQEARWIEQAARQVELPPAVEIPRLPGRLNLYRIPWMRTLLESRWPQFIVRAITLLGFIFTLATALLGTRVGSHNFAIIVVWIAWWTALKLGFIPLGGRSWCSICPIPWVGDWLQHGGMLEKGSQKHGLNLRWPGSLRGSWLQSAGFLLIGLFSAVTLTEPSVTGWVLLALFILATGLSLVFEKRAFCTYLCPIGGFSGMYAKAAPLELKVIDRQVCIQHTEKSCYQACPWGLYPLAFKDSHACGLCLECLRACPKDNLALNLRPYGTDLAAQQSSSRLDETLLALVMLGSAAVFSAVFVGPWGWLKSAAYAIGSRPWLAYSAGFLLICLLVLPGFFAGSIYLWKKINRDMRSLRALIAEYTAVLLPLGLLAWIAFTVSFALPKLNLVLAVLNDPFGWGWNLLNAAGASMSLDVTRISPYLQLLLVAAGVFWSTRLITKRSQATGPRLPFPNLPLLVFIFLYAGILLWLLVG